MAEAIISRRGWGENGKPIPPVLKTETITGNTTWTVPNYRNGGIEVLIFGGGGAGSTSSAYYDWGGGGGANGGGGICIIKYWV